LVLMKGSWQKSQTALVCADLSGYRTPAALLWAFTPRSFLRAASLIFLPFLFSSRQLSQGARTLNLPLRLTGIFPHCGQYSISVMFIFYLLWR
jgi:hypothetical protein